MTTPGETFFLTGLRGSGETAQLLRLKQAPGHQPAGHRPRPQAQCRRDRRRAGGAAAPSPAAQARSAARRRRHRPAGAGLRRPPAHPARAGDGGGTQAESLPADDAESVFPLAGAGTCSRVSSLGAICSAFASARTSASLASAATVRASAASSAFTLPGYEVTWSNNRSTRRVGLFGLPRTGRIHLLVLYAYLRENDSAAR